MTEYTESEFVVTDDQLAEWCVKKIREAQQNVAKWRAHYDQQMQRIENEANSTIEYMSAKLEAYFDTVPHKESKTQQSYKLPGAKLVRKHQQPKFEIDDATTVAWLEENKRYDLVKIAKSADWAALKKITTVNGESVVTEDGEIVPGIKATQREDVFKIETEEEA